MSTEKEGVHESFVMGGVRKDVCPNLAVEASCGIGFRASMLSIRPNEER